MKKQENTRKNIYFCFIAYMKAFDCVDHDKLENSSRDGNIRPPDLPPEKSVYVSWSVVPESSGEGNGTPLQYSCLENPMDGGAC